MTETATGSWIESITAAYPGLLFLVSADGEILATRPGIEAIDMDLEALVGRRIDEVVSHTVGIMNAREAIDRTLASGLVTTVEHDVLDDTERVVSHRRHHYSRVSHDRVAVLSRDVTSERARYDTELLIGDLAQMLLSATIASPERVVREVLARVGAFLDASDVDVFVPGTLGSKTPGGFDRLFDWNPDGGTRFIPYMRPPSPSWVEQTVVAADGPVLVMADDVPETAIITRWVIDNHHLAGVGYIPIELGDAIPGFVSVAWRHEPTRVVRERFEALGPFGTLLATLLLRQRAEQYRIDADARLRSLTEQSHEVLVLLDAEGQPTFLSQAVEPLSGRPAAELGTSSTSIMAHIHADDAAIVTAAFVEARRRPGEPIEFAFRSQPPDGTERQTIGTITNLLGVAGVDSFVVNARDVTAQYHARAALEAAASTDRLTGLPNRETLDRFLADCLERAQPIAVVFLDLDHFKRVNDGYGHTVGDDVLIELGHRMRDSVGSRGIAARFAGDEFVAVMPCRGGDARAFAARLRASIAQPLTVQGRSLRLTASAGVSVAHADFDPEALIRDADTALYEAKRRGRDNHVVVDDALREAAHARVELEAALVSAVDSDELAVHFQPVVELRTERRIGVEALVRWHRPGYGIVEPDAFLPAAEEIGAITQIDAWVLYKALRAAAPWHRDHGITISVNLSTHDLLRDDLISTVTTALSGAELPGDALCLEITETGYAHAPDDATRALQQLRAQGVHVAIDDFGSGYSSIERVRRFPVDSLKIDRSLVEPILDSPRDLAAVRAVIELAHSLELQLTAEGIATRPHHEVLRDLGCDAGQGFLYGRPVPAEQLHWD